MDRFAVFPHYLLSPRTSSLRESAGRPHKTLFEPHGSLICLL
nr:MAG TPA: hypothetical protein [Caudoviricetes sp.]